jgi:hypothetical protein
MIRDVPLEFLIYFFRKDYIALAILFHFLLCVTATCHDIDPKAKAIVLNLLAYSESLSNIVKLLRDKLGVVTYELEQVDVGDRGRSRKLVDNESSHKVLHVKLLTVVGDDCVGFIQKLKGTFQHSSLAVFPFGEEHYFLLSEPLTAYAKDAVRFDQAVVRDVLLEHSPNVSYRWLCFNVKD